MIPHQLIHNSTVQLVYSNIIKDFAADRRRTNFEKDVDDLLFGGMKPAPRKKK